VQGRSRSGSLKRRRENSAGEAVADDADVDDEDRAFGSSSSAADEDEDDDDDDDDQGPKVAGNDAMDADHDHELHHHANGGSRASHHHQLRHRRQQPTPTAPPPAAAGPAPVAPGLLPGSLARVDSMRHRLQGRLQRRAVTGLRHLYGRTAQSLDVVRQTVNLMEVRPTLPRPPVAGLCVCGGRVSHRGPRAAGRRGSMCVPTLRSRQRGCWRCWGPARLTWLSSATSFSMPPPPSRRRCAARLPPPCAASWRCVGEPRPSRAQPLPHFGAGGGGGVVGGGPCGRHSAVGDTDAGQGIHLVAARALGSWAEDVTPRSETR
jgi:hypothetical protein